MSSAAFDFDAALDEVLSATPAPQPNPGGAPFDFDAALDKATKMAPEPTDVRARKLFGKDFRDRLSGIQTQEQERLRKQASDWATKQGIDPQGIRTQVSGDSVTVLVPTGKDSERVFRSSPEYTKSLDLLRKQRDDLLAEIEGSGESVPSSDRFWSGIKVPEGRVNYLRETYGAENVLTVPGDDGNLRQVVVLPKDGKPMVLDPDGLDWGDFLDLSGEAVETLPGVVVAAATKGRGGRLAMMKKEAGADTIGSVLRQVFSAALPGEDFPAPQAADEGDAGPAMAGVGAGEELAKRGAAVASNVAAGAIGTALSDLVAKGINYVRPVRGVIGRRAMKEGSGSQKQADFITESERLREATGVSFDPGQATNNQEFIDIGRALRQKSGSRGIMSRKDVEQIEKTTDFLHRVIDDAYTKGANREGTGKAVVGAYVANDNALKAVRRNAAKADYGEAHELSDGKPVIPMNHLMATIEEIVARESEGLTPKQTQAMVAELHKYGDKTLKPLGEGGAMVPVMSVRELENSLSGVGSMAKGEAEIVTDLSPDKNRAISAALFDALKRDQDEFIESAAESSPAVEALKRARNNYRVNSEAIERARIDALDRVVKANTPKGRRAPLTVDDLRNPEDVVDLVWSTDISSTKAGEMVKAIEGIDPEVGKMLKRSALEGLFRKAATAETSQLGRSEVKLSPDKFANLILREDVSDRIAKVAPEAAPGIMDAAKTMKRLAITAGETRGSPTAANIDIFEGVIDQFNMLKAVTNPSDFLNKMRNLSTAKRFAIVWSDDEMSRQAMQLINPPKWWGTTAAVRAAEQLLANVAKAEVLYDAPREGSEQ